jgi:RNA polymerase sigma factor (sigma-70 family)
VYQTGRSEHGIHLASNPSSSADPLAAPAEEIRRGLDDVNALARIDPRKVQIIEMRFFGGLSVEETAEVLHLSPATVRRDWSIAKFWLYRELGAGTGDGLGTVEATR